MLQKKISLLGNVAVSVAASSHIRADHSAGTDHFRRVESASGGLYLCNAVRDPGFPLITGGIDLAKLDIRSGLSGSHTLC